MDFPPAAACGNVVIDAMAKPKVEQTTSALPVHAATSSRGALPGLLDTLAAMHAGGEPCVLGIVFATLGSTYQKPGALVLLGNGELRHGVISGGCLEPALEARAKAVLLDGRADVVEFDTRSDEDLAFGSGTGCRGRIHLLLLPLAAGAPLALALTRLAAASNPLELTLVIEGPQAGSGHASLQDERWTWGSDGAAGDAQVAANAPGIVYLRLSPPPRVLLFGAGPETPHLHTLMQLLGWTVRVVEHRARWLAFARAAGVAGVIELAPDAAASEWRAQPPGAAVAMTHNYLLDRKHLAHCAESDIGYIGLLGPAARRDALLDELGDDVAARLRGRLHAPVGLDLGGSGPEALALSIVADLQRHFTQQRRERSPAG